MKNIKERIFNHWATSIMSILLFGLWFVFIWFDKVPWWSIFLEAPFSMALLFIKDSTFRDTFKLIRDKFLKK